MRRFKWIDWNLAKIDAHGLSARDVEAAFDHASSLDRRKDGSFKMVAKTPAGRRITVIWRYDYEDDDRSDVLLGLKGPATFVITAF